MLRFQPDSWLEGLLRPFIMADPSAGIYFEVAAPDWRFAAFTTFMLIALLTRRGPALLLPQQSRAALGLLVMFYVWTFASGNGRYFLVGLLLIGPLVAAACRLLPGTRSFRVAALALVIALQSLTVWDFYLPNQWGLVRWYSGPGLYIEASPLREKPAVFITVTDISYSLLAPRFHPQSRWANIMGQHDIVPGTPEYGRLRELLNSPLPTYLISPLNPKFMTDDLQPAEPMKAFFAHSLATQKLQLSDESCAALQSNIAIGKLPLPGEINPLRGFWVCPVHLDSAMKPSGPRESLLAAAGLAEVFNRVEQKCPRFFPPGQGLERSFDGLWMRHYADSDVNLYVDQDARVLYKYFRALNPTFIAGAEQVRNGNFQIDCQKLAGRYRLPWSDTP